MGDTLAEKNLKQPDHNGEMIFLKDIYQSTESLEMHLPVEISRLHDEALALVSKAMNDFSMMDDGKYFSVLSQAIQKERDAAGMLEPSTHVEPIRSILFYNAAVLALECREYDLARQQVAEAMAGIPPRDMVEDLRKILFDSEQPQFYLKDGTQVKEPKKSYKTYSGALVTNLPRRSRFLSQLTSLLPRAQTLEIITSDFEIANFIILSGQWQFADQVRMLVSRSALKTSKNNEKNFMLDLQNMAIEREKEKTDNLSGLLAVSNALSDNRLQIGIHTKDEIHGSAYLIKTHEGSVHGFLGSSGFSEKGMVHPLQLMASVSSENCKELTLLFEALFKTSQSANEYLISIINHHVRNYTPYDVYLKSLYEYFRGREITAGVWEEQESLVYPILSDYQRDGYRQLLHIAGKYGGALLCDGVGLGKTFIALMFIERLVHERKRVAVIVPKSTRDAVWEILIKKFIPNARGLFGNQVVVYNHTDLLRVAAKDRDFPKEMDQIRYQCDAVVVDEAHHFRNLSSKRNQKLFELTENKLVLLLTATPINNSLFDLQHLMEFFTRQNDNCFAHLGINSIRGHLIQKERAIEAMMGMAGNEGEMFMSDFDVVSAERVLRDDTLFRETVVQRSRAYVRKREQFSATMVEFPERQSPKVAAYSLEETYGRLLNKLRKAFDRDDPLLKLPIYYPMAYRRKPAEDIEARKEENRQRQIVGLVRTTMLKRFESSWKAFQYTCEDLLLKLISAYRSLNEKRYEKWKDANLLWLHIIEQHMAERYDHPFDAEETEEEDLLSSFTNTVFSLDKRMFRLKDFVADIEQDMDQLVNFLGHLRGLSEKQDAKVQTLLHLLKNDTLLANHKVVVFSEFRDTARYIFETLKKAGIRHLFEIDSGTKVDRLEVIRRFSPFYNYHDEEMLQQDLAKPIRVLISTDILAEGLNLQDAFLMINYDLHWNPVRLMQRIGRVDRRMNPETEKRILAARPEEKALRGKMWFWNFLPPSELNDLLSLYHRVSHKVLRISETTGLEGEKLLTPDDHFKTLKDFNAAYEGQATTEEQLRLFLNNALHDEPDMESFLEALPWRLFSAKAADGCKPGIFACYRFPSAGKEKNTRELGELRWYFLPDGSTEVMTTVDQINNILACNKDTPRHPGRMLSYRRDRLSIIEAYIRSRELKVRKSVTMAQVAGGQQGEDRLKLVAWMDVSDDGVQKMQ